MARKKTYAIGESAVPELPKQAYPQCDWTSNGKGCRYPRTMTGDVVVAPKTRWFCSAHFGCTNPILGADIVEASQDYEHPKPQADGVPKYVTKWLKENGLERRDVESDGDYKQRLMAFCKAGSKVLAGRPGNREWAEKIMSRVANGEAGPLIAEQMARQALGDHGRTGDG